MIPGLPYDSEVEYLESTGSQWIDTGIVQADNLEVTITFMPVTTSSTVTWGTYFGCGYSDNSAYNILGRHYGTDPTDFNPWFANSTYGECRVPMSTTSMNTVTVKYGSCTKDGSSYTISSSSGRLRNYTMYLFSANQNNTPWRSQPCRISAFTVTTSAGVKLADYIAVRAGQVGYMYDRVTKKLMVNHGTFGVGADVATPVMGLHFYQDHYTSYDYVQDSAFIMLDGIENVGRGKHGNEFSGWHELTKGLAVFQRPWNSVWTENGLRQDGVNGDYIGTNPGLYQSFIQNIDASYPEMVTARSNMVMTAEFVFEITGFTEAQRTNSSKNYYPFAGLSFLNYTEYNYSIWGIGQNGKIVINPAAAWNFGAYALQSTDAVEPIGKHYIALVLDGIDSETGKFKGAIYHNGVAMRLTQPTTSNTYAPFRHSDNTRPYTLRLNTASGAAWTFLGTAHANRLHSRALTATEVATNFRIDNSRYNITGA